MVKIYIDNKIFFVKSTDNLLQACLSSGCNVPFFCWHPALGSIGSCRQCSVKVYRNEEDHVGYIVMACMSDIHEGMRISVMDSDLKIFQKSITELMMLNHPHDCPVCAEGGSCHLQDMTVLNQHSLRRYRFSKRVFKNQYMGPLISHTMNRCITCYRCVRYYSDYAGGKDFGVFGSNNKIYFGRLEDGLLESEYSGNLIDVCPTGVFTDKSNANNFYRKWDLQYTPSICHNCSIGCNIRLGERSGILSRVDNRYNSQVNRHFLCDLGRFGCNYVNQKNFIGSFKRKNNIRKPLNYKDAIILVKKILKKSSYRILGIGSPRASIESNMALSNLVGTENFSNGMLSSLDACMRIITQIIKKSNIHIPSIPEIESYDVILIIGEDITQTASLAALSVRQAIQGSGFYSSISKNYDIPVWNINAIKNIACDKKNTLFIICDDKTKLDDISSYSYYGSLKKQLNFSALILDGIKSNFKNRNINSSSSLDKIHFIVKKLCSAKKPLIISGTSYYSVDIIKISFNIAQSLKKMGLPVGLALFPPSANSVGVSLIPSISIDSLIKIIYSEPIDVLIILENNLYRLYESGFVDHIFRKIRKVIVLDHQINKTVRRSDVFLLSTNFLESSGNIINYEARLQRFFRAYDPNLNNSDQVKLDSWRWIYAVHNNIQSLSMIKNFTIDEMMKLCSSWSTIFEKLCNAAPSASFRIDGQKIARRSSRFSGRAAIHADKSVHELKSEVDVDSMFTSSSEGSQQTDDNFFYSPFSWSPNWNSNQSSFKSSLIPYSKKPIPYEGILLFRLNQKKNFLSFFTKNSFSDKRSSFLLFKIIPYYKLLGSEEMSQNYFLKIMRISHVYVKLNPVDAQKIKIDQGDILQFQVDNKFYNASVKFSKNISSHHIGIPVGLIEFPMDFVNKFAINLIKYSK
ncbi:NADH-quinone oxidoreductase subunit NuoG [Buchnera aphidicola]|uniref:NADH-quinone oxidoreductase subunit G n=1 Tax=Buchnera aphidicola (Cinara strobi) TaxID=1921549 RepID=A0A3B1E9D9_9GAMM|nr:NADH-quinone oxidoreductase subunit NuoG [Buchnera aphidicola]VAX76379.1 NADH-quinone oxidoreductase subunit G [Buchnera aphidicola (Cinara strobi)]